MALSPAKKSAKKVFEENNSVIIAVFSPFGYGKKLNVSRINPFLHF